MNALSSLTLRVRSYFEQNWIRIVFILAGPYVANMPEYEDEDPPSLRLDGPGVRPRAKPAKRSSQIAFVKGVAVTIGLAFTLITVILGVPWTSVIKPGLAFAIVEQIKPEIAKQVSDAIPKPSNAGASNQGAGSRRP